MAIGAYITALMTLAGWHWLAAMPLALVACFVVGLAAWLSGLARERPFPRLRDAGLQHARLPRAAQRGVADRRQPTASSACRARISACFRRCESAAFLLLHARDALVPRRRFAMWGIVRSPWGRAFRGSARKPDPRRKPRGRHPPHHAARLRHRLGRTAGLPGALITPLVQFIEPGSFGARPFAAHPADGRGRRRRLFLRPILGAGVVILLPEIPALHRRLLSHHLCGAVIVMLVLVADGPDRRRGAASRTVLAAAVEPRRHEARSAA